MTEIKEKLVKEKMPEWKKEDLLSDIKIGNWTGFRNKKVIEVLKVKGYDGYYEFEDFVGKTKSLAIFSKEQIKELGVEKISREMLDRELGYGKYNIFSKDDDSHNKSPI